MQLSVSAASPVAPAADRTNASAACVAVGVFFLLWLPAAVLSDGFLTGDACMHYLYARHAFTTPAYLVDVWGRPLVTALYAFPAVAGGRMGVRVTSLLLGVSCGLLAYQLAREQGQRRPALALVFTLAQPLLFLHAFSEMTELPFALALGLAFWAYQRRRWLALAALAGLLPLARPEGFGFFLLAAGALLAHRRPWWLPILFVPLAAWDYRAWALYGHIGPWWTWLAHHWPWAADSLYGHGSLLSFVAVLPVVVSPLALPATLLGIGLGLRETVVGDAQVRGTAGAAEGSLATAKHLRRCRVLTAVIPLLVLVVHSLLYWLGKMASYGEARYLLITAPFWGVLSARGWDYVFARMRWRRPLRWAAAAALAPLAANALHPVVPVHAPPDWRTARRFAEWYRADPAGEARYPRILGSHPGLFYYLGISPNDEARTVARSPQAFARPPRGTLLVWDPTYSSRNADADRVAALDSLAAAGWLPDPSVDAWLNEGAGRASDPLALWHVFRSPP